MFLKTRSPETDTGGDTRSYHSLVPVAVKELFLLKIFCGLLLPFVKRTISIKA